MARKYEMTKARYEGLKKKAVIFNIIIMAISVACIITLFLGDFWKFTIKYKIDEDFLKNVIGSINSEGESSIFDDLVVDETIEVSVSIKSDVLLASITSNSDETAKKLISSVVTDLSSQVGGIMGKVLKVTIKLVVSSALDEYKDQLKDNDFVKDMDLKGLENVIDMVVEGTTKEELKPELYKLIEDIAIQSGIKQEDIETFRKDAEKKIDESVDGMVKAIGNEQGEISSEQIITKLVGETLGVEYKNMDDMANGLAAYLVKQMPKETVDAIRYVILGLAILLLSAAAAWALLFLFAFIRLFTKKKTTFLGFARFFGSLPYILLVLLPLLALWILPRFMEIEELLGSLTFAVSSITLISFIGGFVLMLLKWFGYRKTKKQLKYAVIVNDGSDQEFDEFSKETSNDFSYEKPKNKNNDVFDEDSDKNW